MAHIGVAALGTGAKAIEFEREIVDLHKAIGVHAERVPLSGSARYQSKSHDVDIYVAGRDEAPLVAEVKARRNGSGFAVIETWLGEYDALFLRRDHADPLVVLPWRVWTALNAPAGFLGTARGILRRVANRRDA